MESENTSEDWPLLDGTLKSIIANRKSPSDLSRKRFKGLKAMLKMPKDELRRELLKEIKAEIKFIQSHGNISAGNQPIYKPSSVATQFLSMNDIKPLKKVYIFFTLKNLVLTYLLINAIFLINLYL